MLWCNSWSKAGRGAVLLGVPAYLCSGAMFIHPYRHAVKPFYRFIVGYNIKMGEAEMLITAEAKK